MTRGNFSRILIHALMTDDEKRHHQQMQIDLEKWKTVRKNILGQLIIQTQSMRPGILEEVKQRYPGLGLDEPEPFFELFMSVISSVNLLRLSEAAKKEELDNFNLKLRDLLEAYQKRIDELKEQVSQAEKLLSSADEITENRAAQSDTETIQEVSQIDELSTPDEDDVLVASTDDWLMEESVSFQVEKSPHERKNRESVIEDAIDSARLPKSGGSRKKRQKYIEGGNFDVIFDQWNSIYISWNDDQKEKYCRLIQLIGSGIVSKRDIQDSFITSTPERTIEGQLSRLANEYGLLQSREYRLWEKGTKGRKPIAFELTELGKIAYRCLMSALEKTPIDTRLIKNHKTPDHCELVYRTAQAFSRQGFDTTPDFEPIPLQNGNVFQPDVRISSQDRGTYYVLTMPLGQAKTKKLTAKLNAAAEVNGEKIYLVMRTQREVETYGWKAVNYWAGNVHHAHELTVYLLGLDYLEAMSPHENGAQVDPWFLEQKIEGFEPRKPLV